MRLAAALALVVSLAAGPVMAGPRVVSLDQCADQFVLALADPDDIAGVSPRADDADSWMRHQVNGAPLLRPSLEAVMAARPDVVVRYWGGDARLIRALERTGVRVIQIEDATDFPGVRANVARVANALGRSGRGQDLIAGMDRDLAHSRDAWQGEDALYLTSSGWTSGRGTLVDAMMRAAGLANSWDGPAFAPLSVEGLILQPPRRFVLGFFDALRADRRGVGRHPSVRRRTATRAIVSLPGSILGCPGWFVSDGTRRIARAAA